MKKIFFGLMMLFLLGGCSKENKEDILKNIKKQIDNSNSYVLKGTMEISNDEEAFNYSLESYYLKDDYYKVILVNQMNSHEQIILKNKDGVYVITPSLNKSFKFQSEWPNNSSQSYILDSIVKDIINDKEWTLKKNNNGYVIKSVVNYPNNEELKYQKVYINKDSIIEKVEVYNDKDIIKIKVVMESVDLNAKLNEKDFIIDNYIKENTCVDEDCEKEEERSASIDNIIYPLYIPSNTYLANSEKVDTGSGNRVILTFSGEKNFVLIEEVMKVNPEMEIVPVYGEPVMLSESIGALSANSLSWDANQISYYLASTELTINEMKNIANSLGNSTIVANTK